MPVPESVPAPDPRPGWAFGPAQLAVGTLFVLPWLALALHRGALPGVFIEHWPLSLTMVLGSFVAGASAAGGGAVAFPVMTLLLHVAPPDARDFSLMIQSAGMTSASLVIMLTRTPVDWFVIRWTALGSVLGLAASLFSLAPVIPSRGAKLGFAAVFASFAVALWFMNRASDRARLPRFGPRTPGGGLGLAAVGVVGGVIASLFGTGDDLWVFAVIVLWFGLCEKVGTPTSVIVMASVSLVGTGLRLWTGAVAPVTVERWLACVPVVVLFAPLGARAAARHWTRPQVARFLIAVLLVEFLGAVVILRPSPAEWAFLAAAGAGSLAGYGWMARRGLARLAAAARAEAGQ